MRAICCCVRPRASRSVWMLRPGARRRPRSRRCQPAIANTMAACQCIVNPVDMLSGPASSLQDHGRSEGDTHEQPIAGKHCSRHRRQPRARPRAGGWRWRARARASCWSRADAGALDEVVAAIRAAGGDAHAIAADVADATRRHAIAGQAAARGRPDRRAGPQRQHARAGAAAAAARHRLRGSRARAGREPRRPVPADEGARRADGAARRRARSSTSAPTPRSRRTRAGAPTASRRRRSTTWAASGRRSWPAPACASSTSTPARWTRACTPTRCPTPTAPTLADPARVAAAIVALMQAEPGPAPGARVAIRSGPQAEVSR